MARSWPRPGPHPALPPRGEGSFDPLTGRGLLPNREGEFDRVSVPTMQTTVGPMSEPTDQRSRSTQVVVRRGGAGGPRWAPAAAGGGPPVAPGAPPRPLGPAPPGPGAPL